MSSLEVLATRTRRSWDLPVDLFGVPASGNTRSSQLAPPAHARVLRLARNLHDTVAQRLCGVALVLSADWTPASADEHQALCRSEVTHALEEMHRLIQFSLAQDDAPSAGDAEVELAQLRATHAPDLVLAYPKSPPRLPNEVRRLLDTTLAEALRNATKHACPRTVSITVSIEHQTVLLEVENDGVTASDLKSLGLGIRLLEVEASLQGAALESRAQGESSWIVRLTVPREAHP